MKNSKLTCKQYSFCVEYIRSGGNQSKAYRNSLYDTSNMNADTIKNNAYKLMQNNDVLTTIKELREETIQDVKQSLRIELNDVIGQISDISRNAEKDSDKLKALDMLMKHLGGYNHKPEVEQRDFSIPIINWVETGSEVTEKEFDKAFNTISFVDFEKQNKESW